MSQRGNSMRSPGPYRQPSTTFQQEAQPRQETPPMMRPPPNDSKDFGSRPQPARIDSNFGADQSFGGQQFGSRGGFAQQPGNQSFGGRGGFANQQFRGRGGFANQQFEGRGGFAQQPGNQQFGSRGGFAQQPDNQQFGSRGGFAQQPGNQQFGNRGGFAQQSSNQSFGSRPQFGRNGGSDQNFAGQGQSCGNNDRGESSRKFTCPPGHGSRPMPEYDPEASKQRKKVKDEQSSFGVPSSFKVQSPSDSSPMKIEPPSDVLPSPVEAQVNVQKEVNASNGPQIGKVMKLTLSVDPAAVELTLRNGTITIESKVPMAFHTG